MTDWDKLATSVPLNKLAAQVTSGSAETYEPKGIWSKGAVRSEDGPPPFEAKPGDGPLPPGWLTGRRFGRLLVLGRYTGGGGRNFKASWVVRCSCGIYELRKAKTLKEGKNHECNACRRVDELRTGEYQRAMEARDGA